MKRLLVIGTGGLAREFTTWFSEHHDVVGYASTDLTEHSAFGLPGRLFPIDTTPGEVGTNLAVIAIGSPAAKAKVHRSLASAGFEFPSVVHPSSCVSRSANLGEGVVVSPLCVVSCNVTLGRFVYVNFSCGIGHDAQIGDFVQVNPGVQIGGSCRIGAGTLVGSGSAVLQSIRIGASAIIGSGAVVFANVEDDATMMGNPARRMRALEDRS